MFENGKCPEVSNRANTKLAEKRTTYLHTQLMMLGAEPGLTTRDLTAVSCLSSAGTYRLRPRYVTVLHVIRVLLHLKVGVT